MPKAIKNQQLIDDQWQLLECSEEVLNDPEEQANISIAEHQIAPFKLWQSKTKAQRNTAVYLNSDAQLDELEPYLAELELIAIAFPVFTDGRGYSLARKLRDQYQFEGEIRAIGDVLVDQLFYMQRCGFNSFVLRESAHYTNALAFFDSFDEVYQTAADQRQSILQHRIAQA